MAFRDTLQSEVFAVDDNDMNRNPLHLAEGSLGSTKFSTINVTHWIDFWLIISTK